MDETRRRQEISLEERPIIELPALLKIFLVLLFLGLGLSLLIFPGYMALAVFLGVVVAISILFSPFIGAVLFVAAAYLHPIQLMPELRYSNFTTAFAFIIFLVWAFHVLIYRDFSISKSRQLLYFFGFVVIATASSLVRWGESAFYYIDLLKVFILYFLISNLTKTKRHIFVLVTIMLVLGLLSSLLAIYQYTHGIGLQMSGGILRVTGFAKTPNDLALSLLLLVPFVIGLLARSNRFRVRVVMLFLLFMYMAGIIISFSRAAYLGLIIVMFLSAWKFIRKGKRFISIIAVLLILISVLMSLPEQFWHRAKSITMTETDPSIWARLDGYIVALKIMGDNPLIGVGIGRWSQEYWPRAFAMPLIRTKTSSVEHNIFLEVGVETGFIGLILFILLILYGFKDARESNRIFEKSKIPLLDVFSKSAEIDIVGFLVATMFVAAIHVKFFWIIMGFIVALKSTALKIESESLKK